MGITAISRAAASNLLHEKCITNGHPRECPCDDYRALMALPSVTPKQRWIPVSERLPEKNGWYHCTVIINDLSVTMDLFYKNGKWLDNRRINMFNTYDIYGYGNTSEIHKLSYQELISEFEWGQDVVAWMPLPEHYDPQESE